LFEFFILFIIEKEKRKNFNHLIVKVNKINLKIYSK